MWSCSSHSQRLIQTSTCICNNKATKATALQALHQADQALGQGQALVQALDQARNKVQWVKSFQNSRDTLEERVKKVLDQVLVQVQDKVQAQVQALEVTEDSISESKNRIAGK